MLPASFRPQALRLLSIRAGKHSPAGFFAWEMLCNLLSLHLKLKGCGREVLLAVPSPQSTLNIEVPPPTPSTSDNIWGICSGSRNTFLSVHLGYLHTLPLSSFLLLFLGSQTSVKGTRCWQMSQIRQDVSWVRAGDAVATASQMLRAASQLSLLGV